MKLLNCKRLFKDYLGELEGQIKANQLRKPLLPSKTPFPLTCCICCRKYAIIERMGNHGKQCKEFRSYKDGIIHKWNHTHMESCTYRIMHI